MTDYKNVSSFDTDDRLLAFRKGEREESIVQLINEQLHSIQQAFEGETAEAYPLILLILGIPRSGSTLLSQVLASRLNLGYPSNLMARFYETPAVGAFLQKILIGSRFQNRRQYESIHGVTRDVEEPHEFGYFWSRHLGVCKEVHEPNKDEIKKVNVEKLNIELQSVAAVFGKPVVFKCPLGNFFIPVLKQIPNVLFIDLQRNLIEVAQSFWHVRQERLGSVKKWWSLRTRNYHQLKKLPPLQQIAGQILAIREAVETHLPTVEAHRRIVIHYEMLTESPENVVDDIRQKLLQIDCRVQKVGKPIPDFTFPDRNRIEDQLSSQFKNAFASLGAEQI